MLKPLAQEILEEKLLGRDDAVVVGVSGGADSVALLHILVGFNEALGWNLQLRVAHLNHMLRGLEAEKDAAFVQAAADGLSLPCVVESMDIRQQAEEEGIGVEELARRERYAFLERVCRRSSANTVAVAHHADDHAETVLLRVLRGTGLRGLAGIPRSRIINPGSHIKLVRPLLRRTRGWIRQYLADNGIAFREDRSNRSTEQMRNRIRNLVLPLVEREVNPNVTEALTRLAEQASWLEQFFQETVQTTFDTLVISRTDQVLVLNADVLARKSRIVQSEIIRLAYRSFGLGEQDLGFAHLSAVLEVIADPGSGKQAQLPAGMTIEKRYHQLSFSLPTDRPRESLAPEVTVHLPGVTSLPVRGLEILCETQDVPGEIIPRLRRNLDRMEEYVDFDSVRPPLVVRRRKPGDRFLPLGAPGTKKVSDFLADIKVSPHERERVDILCDQLGPIWVIGHRIDDRVKLTELTRRVLHLQARPLSV